MPDVALTPADPASPGGLVCFGKGVAVVKKRTGNLSPELSRNSVVWSPDTSQSQAFVTKWCPISLALIGGLESPVGVSWDEAHSLARSLHDGRSRSAPGHLQACASSKRRRRAQVRCKPLQRGIVTGPRRSACCSVIDEAVNHSICRLPGDICTCRVERFCHSQAFVTKRIVLASHNQRWRQA